MTKVQCAQVYWTIQDENNHYAELTLTSGNEYEPASDYGLGLACKLTSVILIQRMRMAGASSLFLDVC